MTSHAFSKIENNQYI